jgi:ArsR family transcriptional regulator, cadmium/lead-responsive transcriptional repressor
VAVANRARSVPTEEARAAEFSAGTAAPLLPAADSGVELVARCFRALGDPTRLRLLEFLLSAEHTVSECTRHVGLSQGRVSAHLACLANCGYVRARRAGRFTWYMVADPRVADLVILARSLVADNAAMIAECVRIIPVSTSAPALAGEAVAQSSDDVTR